MQAFLNSMTLLLSLLNSVTSLQERLTSPRDHPISSGVYPLCDLLTEPLNQQTSPLSIYLPVKVYSTVLQQIVNYCKHWFQRLMDWWDTSQLTRGWSGRQCCRSTRLVDSRAGSNPSQPLCFALINWKVEMLSKTFR